MSNAVQRVLDELYPTPSWLPQTFDPTREWVRMVHFSADDYRAASFLDRRALREGMRYATLPYELLSKHTPDSAQRDAHWMFHISHVGSTLISRLLGELDGVLPLREPQLLQALPALPEAVRSERLPILRALLSRVFDEGQRAIVKVSSRLNDLAATIVGHPRDQSKVAMIRMAPERFIAGRLISKRIELRSLAPARLKRLKLSVPGMDEAEAGCDDARLAAAAWAAESSALEAAARTLGCDRVLFVDFDQFLAQPVAQLGTLVRHFSLAASGERLAEIMSGPVMSRHSKNGVRAFDVDARESAIAAQLIEDRAAIAAAMHWMDRVAKKSPELAAALDRTPV